MATLHLVCGLPGSGKSTFAKKLASESPQALHLNADEWMDRIVKDGYDEERRAEVEAIQWEIAQKVLRFGIDVILEFGFWTRKERDKFRNRAKELGADTKLHYMSVPRDELWHRLQKRNEELPPYAFEVKESDLDEWIKIFEEPTPDELG